MADTKSPDSGKQAAGCLMAGLGLIAILAVIITLGNSNDEETQRQTYNATTNIETACAASENDLYRARDLAAASDAEALQTLVSRGTLKMLPTGTQVRVIDAPKGIAYVRVLSGAAIDSRCYLITGSITQTRPAE